MTDRKKDFRKKVFLQNYFEKKNVTIKWHLLKALEKNVNTGTIYKIVSNVPPHVCTTRGACVRACVRACVCVCVCQKSVFWLGWCVFVLFRIFYFLKNFFNSRVDIYLNRVGSIRKRIKIPIFSKKKSF